MRRRSASLRSLVESQLSHSSICTETYSRRANVSLPPGALQHKNKAMTFTSVPFVAGRQEICPGGRFSFCLRRRGTANTWPNCTISRNNWWISGGWLYIYPAICSAHATLSILSFSPPVPFAGGAHVAKTSEPYFGQRVPVWVPFSLLSLRGFDKAPALSVKNYCDFYRP